MMDIAQEHAGNAVLWIDDIFIRQGLKNILADIVFVDDKTRLVFFTANHFDAVKKQHYDLNTHRLVLLIDGHLYQYLNDISLYRLQLIVVLPQSNNLLLILLVLVVSASINQNSISS